MVRAASYLGSLALLASTALGKEVEVNEARAEELYDSGVVHKSLMDHKLVRCSSPLQLYGEMV